METAETPNALNSRCVCLSDRVLDFELCCVLLLLADLDHALVWNCKENKSVSEWMKQCAHFRKHLNLLSRKKGTLNPVKCWDCDSVYFDIFSASSRKEFTRTILTNTTHHQLLNPARDKQQGLFKVRSVCMLVTQCGVSCLIYTGLIYVQIVHYSQTLNLLLPEGKVVPGDIVSGLWLVTLCTVECN